MADPGHVALIEKGPDSWNQWRRDNPDTVPDLRAAHLRAATLCDMDLSGARLSVAILHGADLTGSNLRGADLSSANLDHVILRGADLTGADLRGANLTGGDLRRADLSGVDLRSGILNRADLEEANLSGANLGSTLLYSPGNLTTAQLCSAGSLWLTELHDRMSLVEEHCPHLLERPAST